MHVYNVSIFLSHNFNAKGTSNKYKCVYTLHMQWPMSLIEQLTAIEGMAIKCIVFKIEPTEAICWHDWNQ